MACSAALRKLAAAFPGPILLLSLLVLLGGCESIAYYRQAVAGHLSLLHRAEPIDALVSDQTPVDAGLQARLAIVQDIRAFAREQLQLPVGRAYSRYVELQRDYVVWNVYATGEFSTEPEQWCFPVAGCVGYRGYFAQQAATSKAAALAARGYDTHVAGVAAYSTLGWTADPVLSTFLGRDDLSLAALLFHELSHRLVYVRGETEFNESLASTLEAFAVQQWIAHRAAGDGNVLHRQLQALQQRRALYARFVQVVEQTRQALTVLYNSPLSIEQKRLQKTQQYDALAAQIHAIYAGTPAAETYVAWASSLNNAKLLPVALYSRWQPALHWKLQHTLQAAACNTGASSKANRSVITKEYAENFALASEACQRGLQDFYTVIRRLAKQAGPARKLSLESWQRAAHRDLQANSNEFSAAPAVEARTPDHNT